MLSHRTRGQSGTAAGLAHTRISHFAASPRVAITGIPMATDAMTEFLYAPLIQFQSPRALASANADINGTVAMYAKSTGRVMILEVTTNIVTCAGPSNCVMMIGWLW